jgi:2'-hydroxyisoflavone reductase
MKLLILGGTVFLSRHLVQVAQERGHAVTIFNRGQTDPDSFSGVETLIGDRRCDLNPLCGDRWDSVIDCSGHTPGDVWTMAEQMSGKAAHYTYVSTASVLAQPLARNMDETSPVAELPAGVSLTDENPEYYAALKAECERSVTEGFDGTALIVRPGLVVGPNDPSDRFTYWLRRIKFGGDILVTRPDQPVQFIDVRDLAEWMIRSVEVSLDGTFLATGPGRSLTMGEFLSVLHKMMDVKAYFTAVSDEFLLDNNVEPFVDVPLWVPESLESFMTLDCRAAKGQGLSCRPLEETAMDTLAWDLGRPWDTAVNAGLTLDREAELLDRWMARVPA